MKQRDANALNFTATWWLPRQAATAPLCPAIPAGAPFHERLGRIVQTQLHCVQNILLGALAFSEECLCLGKINFPGEILEGLGVFDKSLK